MVKTAEIRNVKIELLYVPKLTLLGKIMACFIITGEIMGGENMAKLVQNRQFFPVIILPVTSASQDFS